MAPNVKTENWNYNQFKILKHIDIFLSAEGEKMCCAAELSALKTEQTSVD